MAGEEALNFVRRQAVVPCTKPALAVSTACLGWTLRLQRRYPLGGEISQRIDLAYCQ